MKNISTINPAIMENTECLLVKACPTFIDLKPLTYDCSLFLQSLGISLDFLPTKEKK